MSAADADVGRGGPRWSTLCADLGRCAYDVAAGEPDSFCPWREECFADTDPLLPTDDGSVSP